MKPAESIKVGRRTLSVTNRDKPLYPSGFTKGEVIDYYTRITPVMLPYLKGRAVTLKRYPNGTAAPFFFEKRCPSHRPDWVKTATVQGSSNDPVDHCVLDEPASLVWVANLAAIELHVPMAIAKKGDRPTAMVFDFDPGAPATLIDCLNLAIRARDLLDRLGLQCFAKTSGGKGLHLYVPLNTAVTFDQTKTFAKALAENLVTRDPAHVTANMSKAERPGKIFIDWSQNDTHKTTVCAYSLRALAEPSVSTPITWEEIEAAVKAKSDKKLKFKPRDVLARITKQGDCFEPVRTLKQRLPKL